MTLLCVCVGGRVAEGRGRGRGGRGRGRGRGGRGGETYVE